MPIRFRCAYCNQLMAIATRKAGTVVRCPKCAGEIIVPAPEGTQPAADPDANGANGANELPFEDPKFDAVLEEHADQRPTVKAPAEPATKKREEPGSSPSAIHNLKRPRGVFLPMGLFIGTLTGLAVVLILLFVLGFLLGRSSGANQKKAALPPEQNTILARVPSVPPGISMI